MVLGSRFESRKDSYSCDRYENCYNRCSKKYKYFHLMCKREDQYLCLICLSGSLPTVSSRHDNHHRLLAWNWAKKYNPTVLRAYPSKCPSNRLWFKICPFNGNSYSYTLTHECFLPNIKISVALVRKGSIPTERQPLVGEVSANFSG
jgi:hypothetical protein